MADKEFQVRKGLVVANTVLVTSGSNVGINTSSPSVSLHIQSKDAVLVPVGNTSDRPTGANGYFRYNSETNQFEGYANGSWGGIAGSGGGSGGYFKGNLGAVGDVANANNLFRINANTQSNNITIAAGENASATGPISIDVGYSLTIQTGGRAVIL